MENLPFSYAALSRFARLRYISITLTDEDFKSSINISNSTWLSRPRHSVLGTVGSISTERHKRLLRKLNYLTYAH